METLGPTITSSIDEETEVWRGWIKHDQYHSGGGGVAKRLHIEIYSTWDWKRRLTKNTLREYDVNEGKWLSKYSYRSVKISEACRGLGEPGAKLVVHLSAFYTGLCSERRYSVI